MSLGQQEQGETPGQLTIARPCERLEISLLAVRLELVAVTPAKVYDTLQAYSRMSVHLFNVSNMQQCISQFALRDL